MRQKEMKTKAVKNNANCKINEGASRILEILRIKSFRSEYSLHQAIKTRFN